ncbi:golgin subfamily A member 6-like protein 1 isoform X2 [Saccostrea cucullata]|uniref:golgin subfamily A member 6-like protein 1 isoform X2 n=1 Tax=Saccostrea cuccullata TaxID=36930 RepID=UPI002ED26A6A
MMDYSEVLDFSDKGESKLEILKFGYSWAEEMEKQERLEAMELDERKREETVNYNEILDFSDKGETKLEILKFNYSWSEEVERQERLETMALEERERKKIVKALMRKVHQELIDTVPRKLKEMEKLQTEMMNKRELMKSVHRELKIDIERRKTARDMERKVLQECMEKVAKRTNYRTDIQADIHRKIEIMGAVHREIVRVHVEGREKDRLIKVFVRNIIIVANEKVRKDIVSEFISNVINMAKEQLQNQLQQSSRETASAMKIHIGQFQQTMQEKSKSSTKERQLQATEENEKETYFPRKLFLFNIESFKDSPKCNEPNLAKYTPNLSSSLPNSSSSDEHTHGTCSEKKSSPTKTRKSIRTRVLKFFGLR